MRRMVLFSLLVLGAGDAAAQDQASSGRSYFGAPVIKATALRDQGAFLLGGRGGFNLSPSLLLGFGLYGTGSEVDANTAAVSNAPGPLDLKVELFGFDVEYAPRPAAPTHLTFGAFLGGGAAHYVRDHTTEQHGETDFLLVLEPAVGVEQHLTRWLHLNLAASYRLSRGAEQPGLTESDLRGPALALAAKLGRFGERRAGPERAALD